MGDLYNNSSSTTILDNGLAQLGLCSEKDKLLFFVKDKESYTHVPSLWFHLERAEFYKADAVFFKKGIRENEFIPQIYVYNHTQLPLVDKRKLTEVHKNVWTGGEIPIVCVFSKTEIILLDTTRPIQEREGTFSPTYLVENLKQVAKTQKQIYENLAQQLKSGVYWDTADVDFNQTSSYNQLTTLLRKVINKFTAESGLVKHKNIIQKLIIQCILIKYLEERCDKDNNKVFPPSFFEDYGGAQQFSDVLRNGQLFIFFEYLNKDHFNGGIFKWEDHDRLLLEGKQDAFNYLAEVLRGYIDANDQRILEFPDNFSRLYSFNHIPVELISRLYEEFIIKENKKRELESEDLPKVKNDGVAYTPSHLVKLLVNEAMPLNEVPDNLESFKVLDPACGSAIFLVVAFKRLVQWWRQKNNYSNPKLSDLIVLLYAVYGVDKDPNAVQISIFSLCIALCDELSPKEIWEDLKFDNLEGRQIFYRDFFEWKEEIPETLRFNVIVGNPPFVRGGLNKSQRTWKVDECTVVEIPQNQIALKFLSESLSILKDNGLSCLIIKSLPLLYSSSTASQEYLKALTLHYHVNQIFDFTPLARNGVLWDGVDVDTAAVFVTKSNSDFNKNVLHAIFRRTKANKERIYFEIDKYDLHFILREEVYENPYIFKINLLGGGRIKSLYHKYADFTTIEEYLKHNNCEANEGFQFGKPEKAKKSEEFMYEYKSLPTESFREDKIDLSELEIIERDRKFIYIPNKQFFESPNLLIKENIGKTEIPIFLNLDCNFSYRHDVIGIISKNKEIKPLMFLCDLLKKHKSAYRVYIYITSSRILIGRNSSILKEDIMRLPVFDASFKISHSEENIINDILKYTQYFIRRPETAEALNPLIEIKQEIEFYGKEFANTINGLYADEVNSFKLTNIIRFEKENLIGALFSYDDQNKVDPNIITEEEAANLDGLVYFDINESLTATRIIQYYSPNKVLFVKPNQKRYWLASIAYRDADNVFADILNSN